MNFKSHRTIIFLIYLSAMIGNSFFATSIKFLWRYDKYIHFSEYFILGFLLLYAISENSLNKIKYILSLLFLFLLPIIDESIQSFIPNRISSLEDVLFDYIGGYFGYYIYYFNLNRNDNG